MSMRRRTFLKGALAGSAVTLLFSSGLLTPARVLAAWPKRAFEAKSVSEVMSAMAGPDISTVSTQEGAISVVVPELAENGLVVPIKVSTTMPADSISIIVADNPVPLVASYQLSPILEAYIATRIKMAKTSNLIVLVKSRGKLYRYEKRIKVAIGGCGG